MKRKNFLRFKKYVHRAQSTSGRKAARNAVLASRINNPWIDVCLDMFWINPRTKFEVQECNNGRHILIDSRLDGNYYYA